MDPWILRKLPLHLLNRDPVMLPFQTIEVSCKQDLLEVTILWDVGSAMNGLSHCLAKAAGLLRWSVPSKYGVAGGKVFEENIFIYRLSLITVNGSKVIIYTNRFDNIAQPQAKLDMSKAGG